MPKPFIAARIPEALNKALEKHTNKKDGESRTDAVINALNTYLGQPLGVIKDNPEIDRIAELEKRVTVLEKESRVKLVAEGSVQGNLLDNKSVINSEKEDTSEKDQISSDNKVDNKIDNKVGTTEWLSNEEVVSLTGNKISTIRSRFKIGKVIEKGNQRLTPDNSIRYKPRWKLDNIND